MRASIWGCFVLHSLAADEVCPLGVAVCDGFGNATDPDVGVHYWSRRGNDGTGATPHSGPTDFKAKPAWIWENEGDEQIRHTPVIDADRNIYLVTGNGFVRKFREDGTLLWAWRCTPEQGKTTSSGVLYRGSIIVHSTGPPGWLFSLDMESGRENWAVQQPSGEHRHVFSDSEGILAYDGVAVHTQSNLEVDGSNIILAHNTSNGAFLWEFEVDGVFWNFHGHAPGDGTVLAATCCGVIWRLGLHDGQVIYKIREEPAPHTFCSTSGGSMGPNGVFYTAVPDEGNGFHANHMGPGRVYANRVSDGKELWSYGFAKATSNYDETYWQGAWMPPAIGKLGSSSDLSVVLTVGGITSLPHVAWLYPRWMPTIVTLAVSALFNYCHFVHRLTMPYPMPNSIVALHADTGELQWRWSERPWHWRHMKGDAEWLERARKSMTDPQHEIICLPDNAGIPLIAGDGTVYFASGHHGDIHAIRDRDGNGVIDPSEVSTFETGIGFLNGPALAPGLLVVAPCWGPMYVFKS